MKGKIVIKETVRYRKFFYFEPEGLPKPIARYFQLTPKLFIKKLKEYGASKQLIEISNVKESVDMDIIYNQDGEFLGVAVKNQPCEAEVTNNKATIIKLTKK